MSEARTFILDRVITGDDGTFSVIRDAGGSMVCECAELPDRDNQRGISCIPRGLYRVDYLPVSASGKYRDVYHVRDVPGRSGILIHRGNYVGDRSLGLLADSWGCLLPCLRVGVLGNQRAGLGSSSALNRLHKASCRAGFFLEVR